MGVQLGLWPRLSAAFLLVALLGVGLVALLANRVATTELRHYMIRGQMTDAEELASKLEALYASEGDWANASEVLGQGRGQGRGASAGPGEGSGQGQLTLADADGHVVAPSAGSYQLGVVLGNDELQAGIPLMVDDHQVGTLVPSNSAFGHIEQDFIQGVNQALVWGGLAAVAAALSLGTFLAWRITTPVRRLTRAAEQITAGDLASRVVVTTRDEIGQLGATFNEMADNLDRADSLRRQMTADIAHELRTPLSVIRGQVEAVMDGLFPADVEHLAPIHEEALLLARLVDDLRTLAQVDAGQLALEQERTDPRTLVARTTARFAALAAERGIALHAQAPAELPAVLMDSQRIEQVLTNLVSNALRHTPEGGDVTVGAALVGGELVVSVQDTGTGIAPADLPHVFDRLWRGDRSRARDRGGSGLGLTIARRLVEAHDGRIWVESELGVGSTVSLSLPLGSARAGHRG